MWELLYWEEQLFLWMVDYFLQDHLFLCWGRVYLLKKNVSRGCQVIYLWTSVYMAGEGGGGVFFYREHLSLVMGNFLFVKGQLFLWMRDFLWFYLSKGGGLNLAKTINIYGWGSFYLSKYICSYYNIAEQLL